MMLVLFPAADFQFVIMSLYSFGGVILLLGDRKSPVLVGYWYVGGDNLIGALHVIAAVRGHGATGSKGSIDPHFFRCGVHIWRLTPHFLSCSLVPNL